MRHGTFIVCLGLSLFVLAGCQAEPEPLMEEPLNETTPADEANTLHVALQDGFEDDVVEVSVNGEVVYRNDAVSTDYRIGLATSFDTPLPEPPVTVEVRLPGRGLTETLHIDAAAPLHLGVSLMNSTIQFRVSEQPFGYL